MAEVTNIDFSVLSVNVRGLRNYQKRRKVYNWLCKQDCHNGIAFLQETHSDLKSEKSWTNLWRGQSFYSHGTTSSCGVATLIGKNVEFSLEDKVIDDNGRFIILLCQIQGLHFILINYYAPNIETNQVKVLHDISESLSSLKVKEPAQIIWGGEILTVA